MAKSSTKKRASRTSKVTIGAQGASDHTPIHDTLTSTPTILTSLQGKSDLSACMSEATTPSPTSAGSSVASENGVNLSSSDIDNASSGSSDGLNETNSEVRSSLESKRKTSKKRNQKCREAKKNTLHSEQGFTCQDNIEEASSLSESDIDNTTHQTQDEGNPGVDTLTVPSPKETSDPWPNARLPPATLSPVGVVIPKTDPYSTRDHNIWADDGRKSDDTSSNTSVTNSDVSDVSPSSNFNLVMGSISEWETGFQEGGLKCQKGELEQGRLLSQQHLVPGLQPREHHQRQENRSMNESKIFPPLDSTNVIATDIGIEQDHLPEKPSWHDSNAVVATSAIQCLTKAKDMDLSYVAILSAINILSTHHRSTDDKDDATRVNAKARHVEKLYSILLRIMTQKNVADLLGQETVRQGDLTPEALYLQLYSSVLTANYHFQIKDHVLLSQYLIDRQMFDDAISCLNNIDRPQWTAIVFRTAINCHLFSNPRQIHEADVLLDQYLNLNAVKQAPDQRGDSGITYASLEQDRLRQSTIRKWFKARLDASKWEEVKELYEQRRTRLTVHGQVRSSNGASDSTETKPPYTVEPSTHIQFVKDPVAAQQASDRFDTAKNKPRSFSFLSTLKFSSSSGPGSNTLATQNTTTGTSVSVSTQLQNRQLTALDNHMLEECISYKQYEYGWKQVYERMGPNLEDKDTTRLAMRLCKRAFLSHAENNEQEGPSLKVLTDLAVESELDQDSLNPADYGFDDVTWAEDATESCQQGDPDIWEARAWAIYNKAMMSPIAFHNGASPSPSPTGAHPSSQQPSNGARPKSMTSTIGGTSTMSPLSAMTGTKSLTMFLHNILKVSINSTDRSSRYHKAFRIYGMMRSDPFNQYQAQLRDPFVVTCVIKAIYDQVMAVARKPEDISENQESESILSAPPAQQSNISLFSIKSSSNGSPPLGLLFDLAFEIYADMRNLGPIRNLPQLVALVPLTPLVKTPVTHQPSSYFFGRSSSTFSAVSPSTPTVVMKTPSTTIQDLNPTLVPNPQARRLPSELYLALLHLCIQVPDKTISLQVVKTIVADMMTIVGRQACDLDRHLAAALQMYHDRWMCLSVPVVPERRFEKDPVEEVSPSLADTGCIFREWMYRSEEYIREHASSSSNSSSASTSTSDLHDGLSQSVSSPDQVVEIVSPMSCVLGPDTIQEIHSIPGDKSQLPSSSSSSSSSQRASKTGPKPEPADKAEEEEQENESSHYGISKHDADLDELDKYLGDARNQDTCNDRFYWDLIESDTNPVLSSMQFSRKRARAMWRHVGRV